MRHSSKLDGTYNKDGFDLIRLFFCVVLLLGLAWYTEDCCRGPPVLCKYDSRLINSLSTSGACRRSLDNEQFLPSGRQRIKFWH